MTIDLSTRNHSFFIAVCPRLTGCRKIVELCLTALYVYSPKEGGEKGGIWLGRNCADAVREDGVKVIFVQLLARE